jgi:prefoldin beta subunit
MKLSPKIQNQLTQFEQVRQQLQAITTQRIQIESQLREIENASEELKSVTKKKAIYKRVGGLFVKVDDPKKLKDQLKEKKETYDIRIKTLERQENQLKERYGELQQEISEAVQGLEE